jgi:uncharacterized protein (TIGR03086 family)
LTSHPASAPQDQLDLVLGVFGGLLEAVGGEQWAAPTPCTGWTVRDLVNHVVAGNRRFASLLRGGSPAAVDPDAPVPDLLGDEPLAAHREAAEAVVAAFRQPGVLEEMVTVPVGTVPGIVALNVRIIDVLVHGWDLARATGQAARFPDDIVEQELKFTRDTLPNLPPDQRRFAPPQPVADDAPPLDQLAACLGRSVTADP